MTGQIRVLHVVASNRLAGTERHVLGLVSELQAMDCDASLACRASATLVINEAHSQRVPTRSWISSIRSRPSIVHVHDGRSAALGWLLARSDRIALVRTQHFVRPASVTREGSLGSVSREMHRQLNHRIDGYIAVSKAVKVAAMERGETGSAQVTVIPSGIRLPAPDEVATARVSREQAEALLVTAAGRLEAERRFDVLLEAIPHVRRDQPQCRFVIAGSGSAESELKRLAGRLGVEHAVSWTGWLPSIDPLLMQSHVYVNTWPWEGFGMATAEAMAFGLPVIAVRSGASTELVEDGITGRLVPPDDPLALANAISELIENGSRAAAMGERGRERAEAYSMRRTAASTLAFYRGLERVSRRL